MVRRAPERPLNAEPQGSPQRPGNAAPASRRLALPAPVPLPRALRHRSPCSSAPVSVRARGVWRAPSSLQLLLARMRICGWSVVDVAFWLLVLALGVRACAHVAPGVALPASLTVAQVLP
jgi:hypothetical protein